MRLLPPHFWPIIYLWTMVGLSCRPAHELLWQRLKGKHLLGRLLPPWGCKKDGGNVYKDKDRGSYRHQKGFSEGRGQVRVCWPGSVFVCVYPRRPLRTVYIDTQNQRSPIKALHVEDKVFSLLDKTSASPCHDVLHFLLSAIPWGRKRQGQGRVWH